MSLGADVVALDQLAARMQRGNQEIQQVLATLDNRLEATWWEGDDAEACRDQWQAAHRTRIARAAERLATAQVDVRAQAAQQRRTSGH